ERIPAVVLELVDEADTLVATGEIALPGLIVRVAACQDRGALGIMLERLPVPTLQCQRVAHIDMGRRERVLMLRIAGIAVGELLAGGEVLLVDAELLRRANDAECIVVVLDVVDADRIDDLERQPPREIVANPL